MRYFYRSNYEESITPNIPCATGTFKSDKSNEKKVILGFQPKQLLYTVSTSSSANSYRAYDERIRSGYYLDCGSSSYSNWIKVGSLKTTCHLRSIDTDGFTVAKDSSVREYHYFAIGG